MVKVQGFRSRALIMILGAGLAVGPLGFDAAMAKSERGSERSEGHGNSGKDKASTASRGGGTSDKARGQGSGGKPYWKLEAEGQAPGRAQKPKKAKTDLAATDAVGDIEYAVDGPNAHGKLRSQMGALNAAPASPNAMLNASPNSRVGRIAAYAEYLRDAGVSQEKYDAAAGYADGLDGEEPYDIYSGLRDTLSEYYTEAELDDLLGPENPDPEVDDGVERVDTIAEVDALVAELGDQSTEFSQEDALDLLRAAANKDVTDPVVEEVNRLLGVEFPEQTYEPEAPEQDEDVAEAG